MEVQENTEPPRNYHLWTALSTLASALQRKCWLDWGGGLTFYPNMFIVLIGPPGKTRKGTALAVGETLMHSLEMPLSAEALTREALIESLEEAQASFIDESTGVATNHCSLTVLSPELTVFLGHQNLVLMDNLTDWFDCKQKFTYRTKRSGTNVVNGVWVNLLGATTPSMLRAALPMDMIGGGFASRVVFVYEDRKYKLCPIPFYSKEQKQGFDMVKQDLAHIHTLQGQFKVTEEFLNKWVEFYTEQENNPPFKDPHFDGYMSRRQVHVLKLSMLCSVSRSSSLIISEKDLARAITFIESVEINMPRVFSGVGRNENADIIAQLMYTIGDKKKMSFGELMELYWHEVDARTLENMIETLQAMKFCVFKRNQNLEKAQIIHLPRRDEK
jgi:hypothetical protein